MALPPDLIFSLHILTAWLLAILMGTATVVWWIRMRKIGGIAGICFTLFFFFTTLFAICQINFPTLTNETVAISWSVFAFMFVNAAWFFLFLAGEYSNSDRPLVWRIMIVVLSYGVVECALLISLFLPPGAGLVSVTYVASFGWVMKLTYTAFIMDAGFAVCALFLFVQFCFRAFRAAPKNKFGVHIRRLLIALSLGLWIDGFLVAVTYNQDLFPILGGFAPMLEGFAIVGPSIIMATTSFFQIIAFILLFREFRIIYFMPHRAIGIFVVNTSGQIFFDYIFQKQDVTAEGQLLGPALNAINNIVQQTLNLPKSEWIRELRTRSQTFILDTRPIANVAGLLVVSKSTPLLRKALSALVDTIIAKKVTNQADNNKLAIDKNEEWLQVLKTTFPFIPFSE